MVEVVWIDSYIDMTQETSFDASVADFGKLSECRDIGYLVHKNKRGKLVLAVSRCLADDTARFANAIPFRWVKEIIYLEPKKEETHDPRPEGQPLP